MELSQAVAQRTSIRAFRDEPVETSAIIELLEKAAQAPSGGNLQPWRIAVINARTMNRLKALMAERLAGKPHQSGDAAEYAVYPPNLKEPYRSSRFTVGEQMYACLGLDRDDRPARLKWLANNYSFFGAPAAIFCFVDKSMGPPQWSDLGMFLQTLMLLAQQQGLSTCAQECWSAWPRTVSDFCAMDKNLMLFCGVAIGYKDPDAAVNRFRSEREPLENWVKIV